LDGDQSDAVGDETGDQQGVKQADQGRGDHERRADRRLAAVVAVVEAARLRGRPEVVVRAAAATVGALGVVERRPTVLVNLHTMRDTIR